MEALVMEFDATDLDRAARCERSLADETAPPSCSPFFDEAIAATAAGLVVLPCGGPAGKTPLVKWKSLDRPISPARLKKWRADPRFAEANIGIATGASGITVIDCDTPDSLDRLIERFGPTPLIVATPRGGHHLYFRSAGERSSPIELDGLRIDVKSRGGFVVAPPSVRRMGEHAGKGYVFICGSWADVSALPPLDQGALPKSFYRTIPNENEAVGRSTGRRTHDGAETDGRDLGHRNSTLFDRLRTAAPTIESHEALVRAAIAINASFDPPLDSTELTQTVQSVWSYKERQRLFVAGQAALVVPGTVFDMLAATPNGADALMLLLCLLKNHGARCRRGAEFLIVPPAMARANVIGNWGVTRYRKAAETLVAMRLITMTHRGGAHRGDAHRYALNLPMNS